MRGTGRGLLLALVLTGITGMTQAAEDQEAQDKAPIAIVIHGGSGTITRDELTESREQEIRQMLQTAVRAGYDVLAAGGTSLDAVTQAITLLEDSPYFNAGRGAVFNSEGKNELDASIMSGADLSAGAVAAVHNVRHPILLARKVMTDSVHVMLMGAGAEQFGREHGIEFKDDDWFFTEYRWQQLQKARAAAGSQGAYLSETPDELFSTVGAVALDASGNLAAATSTGGMTNKRWGRVGDSPIIGAGTYADNRSCAVSATGHGEYFIRATVARDICARVQYTGASLQEAANQVVKDELVRMGGDGGIIAVDPLGHISMTFNTTGMYRASIGTDGKPYVAIFGDE